MWLLFTKLYTQISKIVNYRQHKALLIDSQSFREFPHKCHFFNDIKPQRMPLNYLVENLYFAVDSGKRKLFFKLV